MIDERVPAPADGDEHEADDDALVSEQPTVDASSPQTQRKTRAAQLKRIAEDTGFLNAVLNDPIGRRWLWQQLDDLGTFKDIFAAGPSGFPDPNATSFYRGQQSYGLRLYRTLVRINPEIVALMHREHDPAFPKPPRPKRTRQPE